MGMIPVLFTVNNIFTKAQRLLSGIIAICGFHNKFSLQKGLNIYIFFN